MRIKVFPDHCSSGLWNEETYGNIDPPESVGISDPALLLALKYWHWTWEFLLIEGKLTRRAAETWLKDGEMLVALLNERYTGIHNFTYRANLSELPDRLADSDADGL